MKQNNPRQTYFHVSAPTNLQKESLWQEIIASIKQYWKTEIKNIIKNAYADFFTIWNLKSAIRYKCGWLVLFLTSVYFAISKLILLFSYSFHVKCIILSNIYFYIVRSMFPFLLNWSQSKASVFNQRVIFVLKLKSFVFFALLDFLKMVIFTMLFRRWSTWWNSTMEITVLF